MTEQLTYIFTIRNMPSATVCRIFAMHAMRSLDDLHRAILQALGWTDEVGFYAFFLDNRLHNSESVVLCPDYHYYDHILEDDFENIFEDDFENEPALADDISLSSLNMTLGQKFLYLFDNMTRYQFEVEFTATANQAGEGVSPYQLIDGYGQMPSWDDEEEY